MEGRNSPADLLLTSNSTRLVEAQELGLTQSIQDSALKEAPPFAFRGPCWKLVGTDNPGSAYLCIYRVSSRKRHNVRGSYFLKWNRLIYSRCGKNDYNIDLIASMVAHHGFEEAKLWLKGVKKNLARRPQGNDRAQVKAIYAGQWDISLGNSYYFGKMLANKEQQE